LAAVRKMHFSASKSSEKACCGIISQKDMAITQFGFMGFGVLKPKLLGLQCTDADLDAFVHFWRVMGHMLGIKDEYNLCTNSLDTTTVRCRTVLQEFLVEILENPTPDFVHMTRVIVDGLWCLEPTLKYESVMFLTNRLAGLRYYHYFDHEIEHEPDKEDLRCKSRFAELDSYSKFLVALQVNVIEFWYQFALVRWYYNMQVLVNRFIIMYFPFLAFYWFGIKDAYVRIPVK
jgi:ER-bound oxygenase mpaB/B'/Rubber oxygenase, catalytic domain